MEARHPSNVDIRRWRRAPGIRPGPLWLLDGPNQEQIYEKYRFKSSQTTATVYSKGKKSEVE